MEYFREDPAPW